MWQELLRGLQLRRDEQVLDIGCGRGAVLLMAANYLSSGIATGRTTGTATGIDLWKRSDQSGNSESVTRRNADLEGVAERTRLHTGDMRKLPYGDGTFDVVLSSIAIHNIENPQGRKQAIDETVRVLKPGGKLVIADIRNTEEYAQCLRELGIEDVKREPLGWRFWFGGPWMAAWVVTGRKGGRR